VSQKLAMPFVRQMMLCGYKNLQYQKHWGYAHYGIDVSSIQGGAGDDPAVYASGSGTVLAVGKDAKLGWGICVLYPGALNHKTGKAQDVTARYMHLRSVSCKAGDKVEAKTKLGVEGKEGTTDYHLHLEFDTDTTPQYATWSPQVAGSTFWKKGVDSTVNPSFLLHVGEGQAVVKPTYNPAWLNQEDFVIPALAEGSEAVCSNCEELQCQLDEARKEIRTLQDRLVQIRKLCQ